MLVSSHNLTSINDLCDRLLLLEKGHLLMDKAHVPFPAASTRNWNRISWMR